MLSNRVPVKPGRASLGTADLAREINVGIFTSSRKIPVFTKPASCCGLFDWHSIYALVSFPLLFLLAVQNFYFMLISFAAMMLLLGVVNGHSHRKRIRSKFFLVWGILSYLQLLLLFQFVVVPQLEVSPESLFRKNFIEFGSEVYVTIDGSKLQAFFSLISSF